MFECLDKSGLTTLKLGLYYCDFGFAGLLVSLLDIDELFDILQILCQLCLGRIQLHRFFNLLVLNSILLSLEIMEPQGILLLL